MNKKDEIIIQKKIDGTLTRNEEARFNKLVDHSPEARDFYQKMSAFDSALKADAAKISKIDLSSDVLNKIDIGRSSRIGEISYRKPIFFLWPGLPAYAAVLFFGLLLGGLATYLAMDSDISPNPQNISGTFGGNTGSGNSVYQDQETQIKIEKLASAEILFAVITIETAGEVECRISGNPGMNFLNHVHILSGECKKLNISDEKGEMGLICTGNTIFQAHSEAGEKFKIGFYSGNKMLKQISLFE